jgi:hypothetical protein
MEELYCNICERSIEALSLENHIKESKHTARRKKLEKQLEINDKIPESKTSVVDLWKKFSTSNDL